MNNILPSTRTIIANLRLEPNGDVQNFFTQTCAIHMDKYVPYDEGNLADYDIEGNKIIYNQDYAEYQYYGIRADGTHAINPENRNRSMHPLAASYWDEHMWTAEQNDVINEVQNYIRRRK